MQGATVRPISSKINDFVSIHAPYAGSDKCNARPGGYEGSFNPRPLCRERHNHRRHGSRIKIMFQSTPPMQGATYRPSSTPGHKQVSIHAPYAGSDSHVAIIGSDSMVSIHAPYAGSDQVIHIVTNKIIVSIHAPYAGSDADKLISSGIYTVFQSTPPMQGATGMAGRQSV